MGKLFDSNSRSPLYGIAILNHPYTLKILRIHDIIISNNNNDKIDTTIKINRKDLIKLVNYFYKGLLNIPQPILGIQEQTNYRESQDYYKVKKLLHFFEKRLYDKEEKILEIILNKLIEILNTCPDLERMDIYNITKNVLNDIGDIRNKYKD